MPFKLFVLPTPETKQYLYTVFRDIPIKIDYDRLCVEIGSSFKEIVPDLTRVYRALPGTLGIWYETSTARSSILLPLVPSPEMCDRREEVGDVWERQFIPYMAITQEFNNTWRVKPRLNSISTGLVDTLPLLTFSAETVLIDDSAVPSQQDFYEDYLKTGLATRQTFLELTG